MHHPFSLAANYEVKTTTMGGRNFSFLRIKTRYCQTYLIFNLTFNMICKMYTLTISITISLLRFKTLMMNFHQWFFYFSSCFPENFSFKTYSILSLSLSIQSNIFIFFYVVYLLALIIFLILCFYVCLCIKLFRFIKRKLLYRKEEKNRLSG